MIERLEIRWLRDGTEAVSATYTYPTPEAASQAMQAAIKELERLTHHARREAP